MEPKKIYRLSFLWILSFVFLFIACEKENDRDFTAGFDFEFLDDNNIRFINTSEGEYYSLEWDFGNNETISTNDKSKSFNVYYPVAGDYVVSLKVLNYTGETKTVEKTIPITKTDLQVSFTAEIDPENPNYLNLSNTTEGDFDSSRWLYRDKVIENEVNYTAYFPYGGTYIIELQIVKGTETFSEQKQVVIAQDDPSYITGFTLAWSDEFDDNFLNDENWTFETGASGWGNNELQNYTNGSNAEIKDGKLIITARKVNDAQSVGSYTSSRMVSMGKKEFTYGRMEIRAKLPSGRGIWPAIWMLGSNFNTAGWPTCGEMDIMEYVGYQPNTIHSTVHTLAGSGSNGDGSSMFLPTAEEEFHVYGLIWTEKELIFYVDEIDNVVHRYAPSNKNSENWPFNQPHFFIMNVAVGGNWGGVQGIDDSIFPQSMEIDFVRVYQPNN